MENKNLDLASFMRVTDEVLEECQKAKKGEHGSIICFDKHGSTTTLSAENTENIEKMIIKTTRFMLGIYAYIQEGKVEARDAWAENMGKKIDKINE